MQLIIRADADSEIGTGHVMRSIALAEHWSEHVGRVTFVTSCSAPIIEKRIATSSTLMSLPYRHPDPRDLSSLGALLSQHEPDQTWVAIDGYHFDAAYQGAIRSRHRVLISDDFGHLPFYDADVIVNQNLDASLIPYRVKPDTRLLLGTNYVLIRREFLNHRMVRPAAPAQARRLLVSFGGADPNNVTLRALEAILTSGEELETRVVLGPANQNVESLTALVQETRADVKLLTSVSDMPSLIAWADLALGGAGSTSWEFAFMGVPLIVVSLAENQSGIAAALDRHGCALSLGPDDAVGADTIAAAVVSVTRDPHRRAAMSKAGQALVDGRGTARITASLLAA